MRSPGKKVRTWMRRGWTLWLAGVLIALAIPTATTAQDEEKPVEEEAAPTELQDAPCIFADKKYGNQSLLCMEGRLFRCHSSATAGIWRPEPEGKCPGSANICTFEGKEYSTGAVVCMLKRVWECDQGATWGLVLDESC